MELEKVKLEILRVLCAQGPVMNLMDVLQAVKENLSADSGNLFFTAVFQLVAEGMISHTLNLKITPGDKINDSLH